jgi:hypothetical protein
VVDITFSGALASLFPQFCLKFGQKFMKLQISVVNIIFSGCYVVLTMLNEFMHSKTVFKQYKIVI